MQEFRGLVDLVDDDVDHELHELTAVGGGSNRIMGGRNFLTHFLRLRWRLLLVESSSPSFLLFEFLQGSFNNLNYAEQFFETLKENTPPRG